VLTLPPYRKDITVYTHESKNEYNRLESDQYSTGTVEHFLDLFKRSKWITESAYKNRQVKIRFVFAENKIVDFIVYYLVK